MGRHLPLAALDLQKERRPRFERGFALRKIIVRVVDALDAGQFVVEATLRHLAANAQRGQMRAHGAPQVVNS
ncbi:MAG: hypothetical protein QOI88_3816 [Gammaproteobacteria bacterium]|jgi:hypothetical protein|nr:hypothetical protein [Gammaproteobacteria bacterium]